METINDRMELLINERFNGNKAAFAKTIGLPPTGLSNYLGTKRRSKPSVEMVTKIVQVLKVDAKWLLTGEGEMLRPASVSHTASGDHSTNVAGNNLAAPNAEKLIDEIAAQRKLTERAMEQTERAREQIDKLTTIIQQLTASNYDKV